MKRFFATFLFVLLMGLALWQLAQAGLLAAKAWAAPVLIERAWNESLEDGERHKPWPWADSSPVARLVVPSKHIERFILQGDNMRNLAFGPVLQKIGSDQLLYGHRDTHFGFLQDLHLKDRIGFQKFQGKAEKWHVTEMKTLHKDDFYLEQDKQESRLILVTCYPFDALWPETDMRFIVVLEKYTDRKNVKV
ncbi:MAG: sortase [Sneathiellales bacterium]|nr:sortase [Sneathiellales bacterium]